MRVVFPRSSLWLWSRCEVAEGCVGRNGSLGRTSVWSSWLFCGALGTGSLLTGACATTQGGHTSSPDGDELEREVVELRRENDELRRQLQMAEDRKLLQTNQDSGSGRYVSKNSPVVLRPQGGGRHEDARPKRPGSVDLRPLPYSAPDAEVMARYESYQADERGEMGRTDLEGASTAQTSDSPRQYRLIGKHRRGVANKNASKGRMKARRNAQEARLAATPGTAKSVAKASAESSSKKLALKRPLGAKGSRSKAKSALSDKSLYEKARRHYLAGERGEANDIFVFIEANYPKSSLADNAAYWQAQDHYEAGRKGQALDGFLRVLQQYPTGNKTEDSMLKIAYCYDEMGKKDDAVAMLKSLIPRAHGETKTLAQNRLEQIAAAGF